MKKREQPELTLETIAHRLDQLQKFNCQKSISLKDLSSELGIKLTALMDIIEAHPRNFQTAQLTIKKKMVLCMSACYPNLADNPENPEYVAKRKTTHAKVIRINYYDNYGSISGYYIEPSKDKLEIQFLNSPEKIESLRQRFALKPASYYIGGYGDSSLIKPEGACEINPSQLNQLVSEGWTVIGEYTLKGFKRYDKYDEFMKVTKPIEE